MGGTPRPPFQAVCFQFLASFWCFSRSHHKGRCGAEAAQLHRPETARSLCLQEPGLDFLVRSALPSPWPPYWVHNGLLRGHGQAV